MNHIICHHEAAQLPLGRDNKIPVLMYGRSPPGHGSGSIGGPVLSAVRRMGLTVHAQAFDLLTIAMAVTAADTFVNRAESADGWARELHLTVPISDPAAWDTATPLLEDALNFLSGDVWTISLQDGGLVPPVPQVRGNLTDISKSDCASLFSGGLDSAIGALDLVAQGRTPVLISHAYRGDADRQRVIRSALPKQLAQFSAIANPRSNTSGANDVQMRTRSFNFLAYGALVAATMADKTKKHTVPLFVPENGLIALNPPLTFRRIGSLSTRTTHPFFLNLMQRVFEEVAIPVQILNPYALATKGEMIRNCQNQATLRQIAHQTVSCGKWKRTNKQCGKCVPCLIRRASFYAAQLPDRTSYAAGGIDLTALLVGDLPKDDLMAMILASKRLDGAKMRRWVPLAGPLPHTRTERDSLLNVAERGITEVKHFLTHEKLL